MNYQQLLVDLQTAIITGQSSNLALKPNPRLTSHQQLSIYAEGYVERLYKVLANTYPASLNMLGKQQFATCAQNYIAVVRSTHFNIDRYPIGFADFISNDISPSIAELAKLEASIAEVFLGEDSQPLTSAQLQSLTEYEFANMSLPLRLAAKLLMTNFAVNDALSAFRAGKEPATIPHSKQFLLIYRHKRRINRLLLTKKEFLLLSQLAAGDTLKEAIDYIEAQYPDEQINADWLQNCFQQWLANGVFRQEVKAR